MRTKYLWIHNSIIIFFLKTYILVDDLMICQVQPNVGRNNWYPKTLAQSIEAHRRIDDRRLGWVELDLYLCPEQGDIG